MTTPPAQLGADTAIPCGVYRTAYPDLPAVEAYEAFLGMPAGTTVDWVLAFAADKPTWPQFETAMLQASTNAAAGTRSAAEWAPLLGPRKLMLAVPACCGGTTWTDEAAGANDTHWATLARTLVTAGLGGCCLRIAREFNGGWYPWSVNPGNAAAHKTAWTRITDKMRGAGFTGPFMWNPYLTQGTFGPSSGAEAAFPADGSVDVIGLDFYDGSYTPAGETIRTTAQQQTAWEKMRDTWDGLTGWRGFSVSHGKPLAYPEWGLQLWNDGTLYKGGGDNPLFIREMAGWFKDTRPWMQALWEDGGMGVSDPDAAGRRQVAVPAARAAYLQAFGYGSS